MDFSGTLVQCKILRNSPPPAPLTQHFTLSMKLALFFYRIDIHGLV